MNIEKGEVRGKAENGARLSKTYHGKKVDVRDSRGEYRLHR